jgi:hypothetical protein
LRSLEGLRLVDPDGVDLRVEDISDCSDDHVRFLIDRCRRLGLFDAPEDDLPEPQQIGEIPRQLALCSLEPRGPDDEPEALGRVELVHDLAEFAALSFVDDLARDSHAIESRHEHEISARDADVCRERRPLGADALLDDLNQHFVAAPKDLLDRGFQ